MRVLHVLDHSLPLQSGYVFRTVAILEQQRAMGWHTEHVTSSKHYGAEGLEEEFDGLRFYRTPGATGLLSRLPVLNQVAVIRTLERRLDELVRELGPDVIHAHSPALNGEAAIRVGRRHGIPVVYELRASWEDAAVDHGTTTEGSLRYRLSRALETRVLLRADAVATICEGLRAEILGRGIPGDKVTVVPNAIDLDRFPWDPPADPELARELGLEGGTVLGFIGSFYRYEGLHLLIEALPRIVEGAPETRVLLVGGGPQDDALRRQASESGVGDRVVFTGRVHHDRVAAYYALTTAFVYPRLAMRLTELVTPLKPLEAMAQGRLVVASDVGGHRELIDPGRTGELFRAGDAADLAAAVLRLLGDPGSWEARRREGRRFVETERRWSAVARRYREIYAAAGARP